MDIVVYAFILFRSWYQKKFIASGPLITIIIISILSLSNVTKISFGLKHQVSGILYYFKDW